MRAALCQVFVESCVGVIANGLRHLGHGRERAKVNAGTHPVGAPEFNIISIVMGLKQAPLMIWVPGSNAADEKRRYRKLPQKAVRGQSVPSRPRHLAFSSPAGMVEDSGAASLPSRIPQWSHAREVFEVFETRNSQPSCRRAKA